MKRNLVLNLFFFVLLVFANGGFSMVLAQTASNSTADPVEYVVEDIKGGQVQVLEENSKTWNLAQEGQLLEPGDEIRTGNNSEASLTMQSDTQVHLSANSDLKIDQIKPNTTGGFLSHLAVLAGIVLSDVKKNLLASHSSFEIEANGVVCGVRGTAFEVSNINGNVVTATHEGKVETVINGESHFVTGGNAASFNGGRYRGIRQLSPAEIGRFHQWRSIRARIRNKRLQRIRNIRMGRRKPWMRRGQSTSQINRRKQVRRRSNHTNQ